MTESTVSGATATNFSDIYSASQQCRALFSRYLKEPGQHEDLIRQYQHQFLTWTSYLGVFAAPNASLDARLRESPDIKSLVSSMLIVLDRSLRQGISEGLSLSSGGPEGFDVIIRGITGALERLQRLAVVIRQSQRTDEVTRVQAFAHKLDEEYLEDIVRALIRTQIGDKAPASLHIQLARSILYRRYRLLYQRRHNQKLQSERRQETEEKEIAILVEYTSTEALEQQSVYLAEPAALGSELSPTLPSKRNLKNNGFVNLPLKAKEFQTSPSSHISSNQSIPARYPERPTIPAGEVDIACPYCCSKLSKSDLKSSKQWRSHVDDDLRLYVCISADCGQSPPSFASREDWSNHMQTEHFRDWPRSIHRPFIWICVFNHYPALEFESEASFQQHLSSEHAESFNTDQKLSSVAKRSKIPTARAFGECPLCEDNVCNQVEPGDEQRTSQKPVYQTSKKVTFQSNDGDHLVTTEPSRCLEFDDDITNRARINSIKLSHHIAEHLKNISLISLRWWDEDVGLAQDMNGSSYSAADIGGSYFDNESLPSGDVFFDEETLGKLKHSQELSSIEEKMGLSESINNNFHRHNDRNFQTRQASFNEGALGGFQLVQLASSEEVERQFTRDQPDVTITSGNTSNEEINTQRTMSLVDNIDSSNARTTLSQSSTKPKASYSPDSLGQDENMDLRDRPKKFSTKATDNGDRLDLQREPSSRIVTRAMTPPQQDQEDQAELYDGKQVKDDNIDQSHFEQESGSVSSGPSINRERFIKDKGKSVAEAPESEEDDIELQGDAPRSSNEKSRLLSLKKKGKGKEPETNLTEVDRPYIFPDDDYEDPFSVLFDDRPKREKSGRKTRREMTTATPGDFSSILHEEDYWGGASEKVYENYSEEDEIATKIVESQSSAYKAIPPSSKNTYRLEGTFVEEGEADTRFRVTQSSEFGIGAVFIVLWPEPRSHQRTDPYDDQATLVAVENEISISYRRFLVVATGEGHSTCVPILTYEGRACKKTGVKYKKHGIIYSCGSMPRLLKGEPDLGFTPIMLTENPGVEDRLHRASRVNYSKLVTVEHNVKVRFLGVIEERDFEIVQQAVDACWADKMRMPPTKPSKHHRSKK